jgi:COX assembly protein 1
MEMAPSPLGQPAPQLPSPGPLQPNLRNPLPLSAAQEAQVRDLYYKRVRGICDDVIKGTASILKWRSSMDKNTSNM